MHTSIYIYAEDALLKQIRVAQWSVSGSMLSEIAEILAKEMGIADWKCSNGFLEKFKKQQNIYGTKTTYQVTAGEVVSVGQDAFDD